MATFLFPTSAELREIERDKIPVLIQNDPLFNIMPIRDADASVVMWEQRDNYKGLQQLRGLGGNPHRVNPLGGKRFIYEPGVYGEYSLVDETELTMRRQFGSFDQPVDISDLVMERQDQLLARRVARLRQIGWTLLTTGTFSVSLATGGIGHTDTYALQTYSAAVAWGTVATATPVLDFRVMSLLSRGYSTSFGRDATAFMNRTTWNSLIGNQNAADLKGMRQVGIGPLLSVGDVNRILLDQDLPQIQIYDDGYFNDSGTWTLFVPNNKVVVVGPRPGNDPVAEYLMTRNVNNPGMAPGPYQKVIQEDDEVPFNVKVHDGHNGGPAIYYPASVVVMTV